jgi:hypothetical protein
MNATTIGGLPVFDPRGAVEAASMSMAPRLAQLAGKRLAILDNTKWNGNKLLRGIRDRLLEQVEFGAVNYYRKQSFSMNAAPAIIDTIVADNDLVLTAIGD